MGTPVFAVPHPSPHAQQLHGFCCNTVAVEQSGTSRAWGSPFLVFHMEDGRNLCDEEFFSPLF